MGLTGAATGGVLALLWLWFDGRPNASPEVPAQTELPEVGPLADGAPETEAVPVPVMLDAGARDGVTVRFAALPPTAELTVDGRALPTNPFTLQVAADGAEHVVEAVLAGYEPERRTVVYDDNVDVTLSLEKATAKVSPPVGVASARGSSRGRGSNPATSATSPGVASAAAVSSRVAGNVKGQDVAMAGEVEIGEDLRGTAPRPPRDIVTDNPYAER